jgi:hypothetical protein
MLRGNHEARLMNGWVEQYGDGSFQNLCAATERAAGLKPRELWSEFNNVFDYLPLAAVSARPQHALLFLMLAEPAAHHTSHITSLRTSLVTLLPAGDTGLHLRRSRRPAAALHVGRM